MRLAAFAAFVALALASSLASALLSPGSAPKDFAVLDADDKPSKLSALRAGRPALVFYEDKEAGEQNERFKQRLGKLREKSAAERKVAVVAIADVGAYDYWPAKGFVKDALRGASKKSGLTVWADWSTAGRASLGAAAHQSNVVLLDGAGKVLWSSAGALSPAQESDLLHRVEVVSP